MQISFSALNWLAIIVAALSTFLLGGIWYSFFEKSWLESNKLTKEDLKSRNLLLVFGLSFIFSIIMALNLALFIGNRVDWKFGMTAGFLTGFGWVFFALAIISLFEKRSYKYLLINGGYMVFAFTIMGAILGAWH